ncbi:uncharacterized protein LOC133771992 [Lepus europaeus]|uniref:uncharacterized protein LOC133771992 n=1 Tax=Lepus europaeus TaxID=9983 RepID=UPI002B49ED98|nr:uncharacterized protein LOC133771992 [Lepus europaeus]
MRGAWAGSWSRGQGMLSLSGLGRGASSCGLGSQGPLRWERGAAGKPVGASTQPWPLLEPGLKWEVGRVPRLGSRCPSAELHPEPGAGARAHPLARIPGSLGHKLDWGSENPQLGRREAGSWQVPCMTRGESPQVPSDSSVKPHPASELPGGLFLKQTAWPPRPKNLHFWRVPEDADGCWSRFETHRFRITDHRPPGSSDPSLVETSTLPVPSPHQASPFLPPSPGGAAGTGLAPSLPWEEAAERPPKVPPEKQGLGVNEGPLCQPHPQAGPLPASQPPRGAKLQVSGSSKASLQTLGVGISPGAPSQDPKAQAGSVPVQAAEARTATRAACQAQTAAGRRAQRARGSGGGPAAGGRGTPERLHRAWVPPRGV